MFQNKIEIFSMLKILDGQAYYVLLCQIWHLEGLSDQNKGIYLTKREFCYPCLVWFMKHYADARNDILISYPSNAI